MIVATQIDARIGDGGFQRAVGGDGDVLHVPGVRSFGIFETVVLFVGIEMSAGRSESGRLALGILMNVDGVFAGGKVFQIELDADAVGRAAAKRRNTDTLPFGVFQFNLGGSGEYGERQRAESSRC